MDVIYLIFGNFHWRKCVCSRNFSPNGWLPYVSTCIQRTTFCIVYFWMGKLLFSLWDMQILNRRVNADLACSVAWSVTYKQGWSTEGILQSTPPVWELQDCKWHLNLSFHNPKCLTLTTPALVSWRPKNDVTMKCADLWRDYQGGLIIKSPQYTGGDFMFLYRFVRRRPQILVHAITFEQLFGFLSFLAQLLALTCRLPD